MLYTNTVESNTLELLIDISKDTIFNDFFLVGGTSLSLQIGHRKSIDLDFFSLKPFDCDLIENVDWGIIKQQISKHTNKLL